MGYLAEVRIAHIAGKLLIHRGSCFGFQKFNLLLSTCLLWLQIQLPNGVRT